MDEKDFRRNLTVQYCFPENNSSCRKEVRAGSGYLLLYIFLSFVSVSTVFLNLLVIISISHFKQLHTPTNMLILSLAVADLLMGLFVMPLKVMELVDTCWYIGQTACVIYLVIQCISASGSVYSMVFIAVDRYIAVCDPLHYASKITVDKTLVFLLLGWSFCFLYSIIFLYFDDHLIPSQISVTCYGECVLVIKHSWVIIDMVLFFLSPCCIILVLYSAIFITARRQAKAVSTVKKIHVTSKIHETKSSSSESKAAKTLGIVIFVYLACWIPFYLSSLTVESLTSSSMVWIVFGWLTFMSSTMNPLIYAIFYPWFRVSAKCIITCSIFESSSSQFNLFPNNV